MLGDDVARRPRCVLRKIIRQSAWDLVTAAVWAFIDEASIPFPVDPCARNVEWIAHRVEEEGGVVLLHIKSSTPLFDTSRKTCLSRRYSSFCIAGGVVLQSRRDGFGAYGWRTSPDF